MAPVHRDKARLNSRQQTVGHLIDAAPGIVASAVAEHGHGYLNLHDRIEIQRELRDDLVGTLSRELLGPFEGPSEALRQRPTGRYLIGRLAPAGTTVSPEDNAPQAQQRKLRRYR